MVIPTLTVGEVLVMPPTFQGTFFKSPGSKLEVSRATVFVPWRGDLTQKKTTRNTKLDFLWLLLGCVISVLGASL